MSHALDVLAEPTRRRILDALRPERAVGDIAAELALSQPLVSKHLKVLRDAGLVDVRVDARMLAYSQPEYPEWARDRGLEGSVRVEVEILADATVGAVRVAQSSGVAAFDDAAVAAVRKWRFAAATLDGVAFASTITLPAIRFRLE